MLLTHTLTQKNSLTWKTTTDNRRTTDSHANRDAVHLDWRVRVIVAIRRRALDRLDDVQAFGHLAENRVLRRRQIVTPVIEKVVVHRVDEELRTARARLARVGHAQRSDVVRGAIVEFIRDASLARVALDGFARGQILKG